MDLTKFLQPACCTIPLLFCTLSVSLLFPSVAIWREGDVWGPWLFLQVQHAATLRKPTALHETTRITRTAVSPWDQTNCCRFPDVSSSGVAGCEINPLRNIMRHTWHPGEEKGYKWANDSTTYYDLGVFCYIGARQACCGQKCVLILFINVIIVACLILFLLLWNELLVHCSNATKPAQFFPCLDFWELFLIVLCLRRLGWSFHEYKLSWGRQKGRMDGRKEAMNEGWKQGSKDW